MLDKEKVNLNENKYLLGFFLGGGGGGRGEEWKKQQVESTFFKQKFPSSFFLEGNITSHRD